MTVVQWRWVSAAAIAVLTIASESGAGFAAGFGLREGETDWMANAFAGEAGDHSIGGGFSHSGSLGGDWGCSAGGGGGSVLGGSKSVGGPPGDGKGSRCGDGKEGSGREKCCGGGDGNEGSGGGGGGDHVRGG